MRHRPLFRTTPGGGRNCWRIRSCATDLLARAFADVGDGEWQRTGFRSDGAAFTIDSFARYMVHDPVHHVHDVEQGYAELSD